MEKKKRRVRVIIRLIFEVFLIAIWLSAFFIGYFIQKTVYVIIPLVVMLRCGTLLVRIASGSSSDK